MSLPSFLFNSLHCNVHFKPNTPCLLKYKYFSVWRRFYEVGEIKHQVCGKRQTAEMTT